MPIARLNVEQRKERRREMAEAVKSGKPAIDVSIDFGVSTATVYGACRENGMVGKPGPRPGVIYRSTWRIVSRAEWEAADWSLRDTDLSKRFGVSRERVRQVRNALGKPRSEFHNNWATTAQLIRWIRENRESISGLWAQDIVDLVPFPTKKLHVRRACAKLGIELRQRVGAERAISKDNIGQFVVVKAGPLVTPCWEWSGKLWGNGYGRVGQSYAHRFVCEIFHGAIPDGLWCLHKCDNPICVNPDHLYAGTPADNANDREIRGHGAGGHLTEQQVADIRRERSMSRVSLRKLAATYGVSAPTILRAIRNAEARKAGIQAKAS